MARCKIPKEKAFSCYNALGVGRSYRAVADKFGVSKTAIANCAVREKWQERIEECERKTREEIERKSVDSAVEMALMPLAKANPATPPSRAATRCSRTSVVGFMIRV